MTDIRTRTADIIEPYVISTRRRRESAESIAAELDFHGHLIGGVVRNDVQERVAAQLQCSMSWSTAEKAAAELAAAGLLANLPNP